MYNKIYLLQFYYNYDSNCNVYNYTYRICIMYTRIILYKLGNYKSKF